MTISSHNVKQNGPGIQGKDISGKSGLDNMRGHCLHKRYTMEADKEPGNQTMMSIINKVRRELKQNSDRKTLISNRRFFKEEIRLYGVKTTVVIKTGKNT